MFSSSATGLASELRAGLCPEEEVAARADAGRMATSVSCPGTSRWPQLEQNTASGSGLGPQVEHAAGGEPAERMLRTRAATIASIVSEVTSGDSARSASRASVVYLAFRNS